MLVMKLDNNMLFRGHSLEDSGFIYPPFFFGSQALPRSSYFGNF